MENEEINQDTQDMLNQTRLNSIQSKEDRDSEIGSEEWQKEMAKKLMDKMVKDAEIAVWGTTELDVLKWAQEQMRPGPEIDSKMFSDMIQYGQAAVHIDKDGKQTHIETHPNKLYINKSKIAMKLKDIIDKQFRIPGISLKMMERVGNTDGNYSIVRPVQSIGWNEAMKLGNDTEVEVDEVKYGANSGRDNTITTTDSTGKSQQHQVGYMQTVEGSQRVTTLEQIQMQLQSIQYRLDNKKYDEGMYGYNMYITTVQEDVEYLRKAIENTIDDGLQINGLI